MNKNNIILLHGALRSKQQFEQLEKVLSNQFNVFTLNFEGHGDKVSDSEFSIDLFTNNTLAFLRENDIEQTNIFGYSMGGYVGLKLARLYPERVNSIVTLGTKFNWTRESAAKEIKMLNPEVIAEKVPKFAEHLERTHYPNDWKAILNKTAKMMSDLAEGKKMNNSDLSQIQHRVLIGIGALDKMVSIDESENAVSHLINGQLKIIEGFQHPIEKNDHNQLAAIITEFINEVVLKL